MKRRKSCNEQSPERNIKKHKSNESSWLQLEFFKELDLDLNECFSTMPEYSESPPNNYLDLLNTGSDQNQDEPSLLEVLQKPICEITSFSRSRRRDGEYVSTVLNNCPIGKTRKFRAAMTRFAGV